MTDTTLSTWVEKIFVETPYLRALLQLDPTGIGSAYEVMLSHRIAEMRQKRYLIFLEELAREEIPLTQEMVNGDEFLHAFFTTARIALNNRREEKIRMLARLLISGVQRHETHSDKFEEFAEIMESLTVRELNLLLLLRSFEMTGDKSKNKNELQFATSFWDGFEKEAQNTFGVNQDILRSMLSRLNRTGLYETIVGTYSDYKGGKGRTTELFEEFTQWVIKESH